jgi:hypothetical protein
LVVDESEIKVGDYITDKYRVWQWKDDSSLLGRHKIIAHLPLDDSPILEGVPLLPPIEDDVEELAIEVYGKGVNNDYEEGFVDGYNKAREKYNLTLSNFIELYVNETGYGMDMWSNEENETMSTIAKIIQSFHQYPTDFECEMEEYCGSPFTTERCPKCIDCCDRAYQRPKTITTDQGVQWMGKYK